MDEDYSFYLSGASNRRQLFEDRDSTIRFKNKQSDDMMDITFEKIDVLEEESARSPDFSPNIHLENASEDLATQNQRRQSNLLGVEFTTQLNGPKTLFGQQTPQQDNNAIIIGEPVKLNLVWRKQFFSLFQIVLYVLRLTKLTRSKLYPEMFNKLAVEIIADKAFDKSILVNDKNKNKQNNSKNVLNRKKCKCINLIKIVNKSTQAILSVLYIINDKFKKFMGYLDEKIVPWDPLSTFVIFWEHFQLVCLTFIFFYIPFRTSVQLIEICENIHDYIHLVFIGDMIVKMNTQFFYEGELIKNHQDILINYMKTSLLTDFVAVFVLLFPNLYIFSREEYIILLLKMNAFLKIIDKIKENIFGVTKLELFNLFNLIILDIFIGHVVACEWVALGLWQQKYDMDNWIDINNLKSVSLVSLYVKSLYFSIVTMNTVGYGDFTPKTDLERAADMLVILVGCMLFGYSISKIGTILQSINKNKEKLTQSMGGVNLYMKSNNLGLDIQNKVRKYLEYIHLKRDEEQQSNDFIKLLSNNLQREILIKVQGNALKQVDIFMKNFSSEFLEELALKVKQIYFCSDETILEEDQYVQDPSIYILNQGRVEISFRDTNCRILKDKGEYFGQVEFFKMEQNSLYTIKSLGITSLFQIQLTDFINLIQTYPPEKEIFYQISHGVKFHHRYQQLVCACRICCSTSHTEQNCGFVQYKPNKFKLINSFHLTQTRQKQGQRAKKKYNTLQNQKNVTKQNILQERIKIIKIKKVEDALYDTDEEGTDQATEKVQTKNEIEGEEIDLKVKDDIQEDYQEYDTSSSNESEVRTSTNTKRSNRNQIQIQGTGLQLGNIIINPISSESQPANKLVRQQSIQLSVQKQLNENEIEKKNNSKLRFPSTEDLIKFEKQSNKVQNSMTSIKQRKRKISFNVQNENASINEISPKAETNRELSYKNIQEEEDDNSQADYNSSNLVKTDTYSKKKQDKISKASQIKNSQLEQFVNRPPSKSNDNLSQQDKNQKLIDSQQLPPILQELGLGIGGILETRKQLDASDQQILLQQKYNSKHFTDGFPKSGNFSNAEIQSKGDTLDSKSLNINIQETKSIHKRRQSSFFHLDPGTKHKQSDSNNQFQRLQTLDGQIQQQQHISNLNPNVQLDSQFESLKTQLIQFMQTNTIQSYQQNQFQQSQIPKKQQQGLNSNNEDIRNSDKDINPTEGFIQQNIQSKEESQLDDIGKDYKLYFPWNNKSNVLCYISRLNLAKNILSKPKAKYRHTQKFIKKQKK